MPSLYGRHVQTFSLMISVLALVLAGGAVVYARRQAGSAAEQAREAKRANDSLADERDRLMAYAAQLEEQNRIRWEVQDAGGPQMALRNVGTHPAHDVRAWTHSGSFINNGGPSLTADTITPGSSIRFALAKSPYVGEGHELLVTWRGQPDPVAVALP